MSGLRKTFAVTEPVYCTSLTGPDPPDHRRGGRRELRGLAEEALAVRHGEQVRPERVDLGEQPRLGRGGDAEHRHDRGDPDRDPERREGGPELSRPQSDEGDPPEVGGPELARPRAARSSPSAAGLLVGDDPARGPGRDRPRALAPAGSPHACRATIQPVEHLDLPRKALGDLALVGDDDDRRPLGVQPFEQREDRLAVDAVEVPGRLVGEDDRRVAGERPGDRDTLALAARELGRPGAAAVREPDLRERLVRQLAPFARAPRRRRAARRRRCRARSRARRGRTAGRRSRSGRPQRRELAVRELPRRRGP